MPLNLEIKARIRSISHAQAKARSLGARRKASLHQCDTYFNVAKGRLKLRETNGRDAELIFYDRGESSNVRKSHYGIFRCEDSDHLRELLGSANGIRCRVEKVRQLYMFGTTRIHLDRVRSLGTFVEFEVPVGHEAETARQTMTLLIRSFELREADFVRGSYSDLLENRRKERVRKVAIRQRDR